MRSLPKLPRSGRERQQIRSYFAGKPADRAPDVNFKLGIGAALPTRVQLQKPPPGISSARGGYQSDEYVILGNAAGCDDDEDVDIFSRPTQSM
jgi:hypothetical protein